MSLLEKSVEHPVWSHHFSLYKHRWFPGITSQLVSSSSLDISNLGSLNYLQHNDWISFSTPLLAQIFHFLLSYKGYTIFHCGLNCSERLFTVGNLKTSQNFVSENISERKLLHWLSKEQDNSTFKKFLATGYLLEKMVHWAKNLRPDHFVMAL